MSLIRANSSSHPLAIVDQPLYLLLPYREILQKLLSISNLIERGGVQPLNLTSYNLYFHKMNWQGTEWQPDAWVKI